MTLAQAQAPAALASAATAPLATRDSGRIYCVTLGRHQFHYDESGSELGCWFTPKDVQVPVTATFMGFGEKAQVDAYVAAHYPGWEICESYVKGSGY